MPEVGDTLGRYTLLRRLAVGGMGEVFVAAKPGPVGFGPSVALKVLRDELACDQTFVDMLVDEANISMFLNHQNVVSVLDLGTDDGTYYIAMEYVQGITVERLVESLSARGKKLAIPVALYMAAELCRALKYAHTRVNHAGEPLNIIHRDVTPANILLSIQGEVKLTDFGIARAKGRVHQTQAGVLKGKFGYMAPEMVRYEQIDARADLFCAGVCLYLMLSGQHPVAGAAVMEAIQKYEDKRIPPPSSIQPEIPAALDAIVMRCLEPKVENRWASAAALGDALQDILLQSAEWRGAAQDGARLIGQQMRIVAPECFEAPVSAEQARHLLERARADKARRRGAAEPKSLGRDRLASLEDRIPSGAFPAVTREPKVGGSLASTARRRPADEVDLPTASSLPVITPDMDFGPTPAVLGDQETDEQLSAGKVRAARASLADVDTDEQNAATDDALDIVREDGAGASAPADPTDAMEAINLGGFPDSSTDRSRLRPEILDEPSLPAAGEGGYAVAPGDLVVDHTIAEAPSYEEQVIDRELSASTGDDGATVVAYEGDDTADEVRDVLGASTLATPPAPRDEPTVAGVMMEGFGMATNPLEPEGATVAHPSPHVGLPDDDPDAATIIPGGPDYSAFDTSDWRPAGAEDDLADATLLDGLDASDVHQAMEAAKARQASSVVATEAEGSIPRMDSQAMDALVRESLQTNNLSPMDPASFGRPTPDPKPLDGPIRIGGQEAPPGAIGPGIQGPAEAAASLWAPGAPQGSGSLAPQPLPGPSRSPAPARALVPTRSPPPQLQEDPPEVGANTGRWMAGQLDPNALSWDDDAAARRAVATRNQGAGAPYAPPMQPASYPPEHAAPTRATGSAEYRPPGFWARNGILVATVVLAVALASGVTYAWFFTRAFWPKLKLDSQPIGALVVVDGNELPGTTPLVVQVEPEKRHLIEFRLNGYQRTMREITEGVTRFRNYTLKVDLDRAMRQVHLPAEGTIFVNGEAVATGKDVELPQLPETGPITLRVVAKGYEPYELQFESPDDIPASIDVPLSKR